MTIVRTDKEIIIRLSASTDTQGVQRLINFLKFKEATSRSKAKQSEIDKIAKQANKKWWAKNKKKFIK